MVINKNDDRKQADKRTYAMAFSVPSTSQEEQPKAKKQLSNNSIISTKLTLSKTESDRVLIDGDGVLLASIIDHMKRDLTYQEVTDAKIIMEKKLTKEDIEGNQGRLAIPRNSLIESFLTNHEEEHINLKVDGNKNSNINVKVIVGISVYEILLTKWNYNQSEKQKAEYRDPGYKYVLKNGRSGEWSKLKNDHGLKKDDAILLATFRHDNFLHFVIIKGTPVKQFGKLIGYRYSMD